MQLRAPLVRTFTALLIVAVLGVALLTAATSMGWKVFELQGHSMEPSIAPGSLVIAREVSPQSLSIGDVILFEAGWLAPGEEVTAAHRITHVAANGNGVLAHTKGDGNGVSDPIPTIIEGQALRAVFTVANGQQMLTYAYLAFTALVATIGYVTLVRLGVNFWGHAHRTPIARPVPTA